MVGTTASAPRRQPEAEGGGGIPTRDEWIGPVPSAPTVCPATGAVFKGDYERAKRASRARAKRSPLGWCERSEAAEGGGGTRRRKNHKPVGRWITCMARKGRGKATVKSMAGYTKGNVNEVLALGTLATLTGVIAVFDETVIQRTLCSSLVGIWSVSDWTPAAGVGPIMVGVSHSDYSLVEIEQFIETSSSWDPGNKIAQEQANRLIRKVGVLQHVVSASTPVVLNDGKPIKTKLNWILNEGDTLTLFAYNLGTSSFATTDPQVRLDGHVNLWARGG